MNKLQTFDTPRNITIYINNCEELGFFFFLYRHTNSRASKFGMYTNWTCGGKSLNDKKRKMFISVQIVFSTSVQAEYDTWSNFEVQLVWIQSFCSLTVALTRLKKPVCPITYPSLEGREQGELAQSEMQGFELGSIISFPIMLNIAVSTPP